MHLDKRKLLGVFFHNLLSPLHLFYSLCSSLKTRLPFRDFAFAVPTTSTYAPRSHYWLAHFPQGSTQVLSARSFPVTLDSNELLTTYPALFFCRTYYHLIYFMYIYTYPYTTILYHLAIKVIGHISDI